MAYALLYKAAKPNKTNAVRGGQLIKVEEMGKFNGQKRHALNAAILAGIILMTVSVVSSADMQLTVQVTEPFEVNGVVHPAGTLQVKTVRDYTPTQTINELWLGGDCLGYIMAHKAEAEVTYPVRTHTMFFTRSSKGHLVLAGYVLLKNDSSKLFRYQHQVKADGWNAGILEPEPVFIAGSLR